MRAALAARARAAGFTLIEILAVVLILGLLASLVAPPLGLRSGRALDDAAGQISAACELARQRAVMTGRAHRLLLDLDWNLHRVEWIAPPEPDAASEEQPSQLIDLSAPPQEAGEFTPIPGSLGRDARLQGGVSVLAVELPNGSVKSGWLALQFEPDGTADPALIWIGDADGRPRRILELLPLADAVVVHDAEA